jgi:hypothetical protein
MLSVPVSRVAEPNHTEAAPGNWGGLFLGGAPGVDADGRPLRAARLRTIQFEIAPNIPGRRIAS